MSTRTKTNFPLFGHGRELCHTVLPTTEDVVRYYLLLQHNTIEERKGQQPSISDISERVALQLEQLWIKSSIPTVSHKRIVQKIRQTIEKYRSITKIPKSRKLTNSFTVKTNNFKEACKVLFDLAACKCNFSDCKCDKFHRVPIKEQMFLADQRGPRKMYIGSVDILTTNKLKRKMHRKSIKKSVTTTSNTLPGMLAQRATAVDQVADAESSTSAIDSDSDNDSDYSLPYTEASSSTPKGPIQNRLHLGSVAKLSDRYGVSDRAAAALVSSVLEDVGVIHSLDTSMVIDRNKIRRQRKRTRKEIVETAKGGHLHGLYFDGRKDRTLINEKEGHKFYRRTITEEHIALVQQPEGTFVGHITPSSGSAASIASGIVEFLTQHNVESLVAIGCDGTAVNTGQKGGAIRLIEQKLKKPLQWFICQLHANELLLRHFLKHVDDSKTTGPNTYSGITGKQLEICEHLSIVVFERIESDLPNVDSGDLSTDQNYLLDIFNAVRSGSCNNCQNS